MIIVISKFILMLHAMPPMISTRFMTEQVAQNSRQYIRIADCTGFPD